VGKKANPLEWTVSVFRILQRKVVDLASDRALRGVARNIGFHDGAIVAERLQHKKFFG